MRFLKLSAAVLFFTALLTPEVSAEDSSIPNGWLLYHDYSSYTAMDSKVHLSDLSAGTVRDIDSSDFVNAMNADFGSHCYDIVFMAIDPHADEWDIFRYNAISGVLTNLTANSGFRNEDPKFSPDGSRIVFKRGYWSAQANDFIYDLAEMDLRTNEIRLLTDDPSEQSMPCYSADGNSIYFAELENGESSIRRLAYDTLGMEYIYRENGIHAYYPLASEHGLYFTKWFSPQSRNDCIVRFDGTALEMLPFCSDDCNTSDPFPLADGQLFFSSTQNGSYDLYFFDGTQTSALHSLNTEQNELGAAFYGMHEAEKIIRNTTDFLHARSCVDMNMDADGNGVVNGFDLAFFKRSVE